MKLRLYPSPILLQKASKVEFPDHDVLNARAMRELCDREKGYALAAPQAGISKNYFVLTSRQELTSRAPWLFVNPEIIETDGEFLYAETCLSIPALWPKGVTSDRSDTAGRLKRMPVIKRPHRVVLRYQDQRGEVREFEASGLLGRVLLHELDHLAGKTYLDLVLPADRPEVAAALEAAGLPVPWSDLPEGPKG